MEIQTRITTRIYTVSKDSDPEMFSAPLKRVREAMLTVKKALRELQPRLAECGVTKMYVYPERKREDAIDIPSIDVHVDFRCSGKAGELSPEQEESIAEILASYLAPRKIGEMILDYPDPIQQCFLEEKLGLKELSSNFVSRVLGRCLIIVGTFIQAKVIGYDKAKRTATLAADGSKAHDGGVGTSSVSGKWKLVRRIPPGDLDWVILKLECTEGYVAEMQGSTVEVEINGQIYELGEINRRGVARAKAPAGLDLSQAIVRIYKSNTYNDSAGDSNDA